jgi:hypothetical protein
LVKHNGYYARMYKLQDGPRPFLTPHSRRAEEPGETDEPIPLARKART